MSNIAWSLATLVCVNRPLLYVISTTAKAIIGEFQAQGISNSAWAFATLQLHDDPLMHVLADAALRLMNTFNVQQLGNTSWAFAVSSKRHLELQSSLREACLLIGSSMDSRAGQQHARAAVFADDLVGPLGYEPPRIVLETTGIVVIFKPPGWETDVYDVGQFGVPITPVARFYLLSTFIGKLFPKEDFPICHSPDRSFGFVHRLDQMSSGLILSTTCYKSHMLMHWQMCSYRVDREYVVLCHGYFGEGPGVLQLRGRILEGTFRVRQRSSFGERCKVHPRGKPACSKVTRLAHAWWHAGDRFSLVAISILTGRQHQIRTHLQHAGHPAVYDGRYVRSAILLQGCRPQDAARASDKEPRVQPLPARHRKELALRGANLP